VVGGSVDFSKGMAWASLANAADLNFERSDAFSVAGWFKPFSNSGGTLVSKMDANAVTGWGLFQFGTATTPRYALGLQGNGNANHAMAAGTPVSLGTWHYVVATYSGTSTVAGMTIYVDGVSQPLSTIADTLTLSMVNPTAPAAINGRGGSTNMTTDGVDEVRVSARGVVLSPAWVTATYNNQRSPATFFTVALGLTNAP